MVAGEKFPTLKSLPKSGRDYGDFNSGFAVDRRFTQVLSEEIQDGER
jgi:hypothetical protein